MSNFTFDIVLANYVTEQSLPIVVRCLDSVRECSADYRLIFIDNGSPARALAPTLTALRKHRNVVEILNDSNLGFVKATNQGIAASKADYVVLLNNDTEVAPDWLTKMRAAFTGRIGLVGPRSNPNGTISGSLPYLDAVVLPPGNMLVFFCVMIAREVIKNIGGLDEEFGVGLGDDDHYCWKAQEAGYSLCYLGNLTIKHHHKTTFRQLYTPAKIKEMGMNAVGIIKRKTKGSKTTPQCLRGR